MRNRLPTEDNKLEERKRLIPRRRLGIITEKIKRNEQEEERKDQEKEGGKPQKEIPGKSVKAVKEDGKLKKVGRKKEIEVGRITKKTQQKKLEEERNRKKQEYAIKDWLKSQGDKKEIIEKLIEQEIKKDK